VKKLLDLLRDLFCPGLMPGEQRKGYNHR
jgi:hypothetical protein